MKRLAVIFVLVTALLPMLSSSVLAEESVCAKVAIEIVQEVTLERQAFDAKLVITNNIPDKDLERIRVNVTVKDSLGNLKNEAFFVKVSSLENIGVDGTGTVGANSRGEAHWLIIPSPGAGGDTTAGVAYLIGATLAYTINGVEEIVAINPDRITVRPVAKLYLDYFMPHEVLGDNPFTPQTEAPVPFPLAVRVLNDGFGPANKLKIDSAQPKIVDNKQGLLVDFKLLGAAVNDRPVSPTLTVDMGDVSSKSGATGLWEMISTLSGRFVDLTVSFTHDPGLGGELTSIIQETVAHYLTHRVKANLPGRDDRLDFLAYDNVADPLPSHIYESEYPDGVAERESTRSPVTVVSPASLPARPTPESPRVETTLNVAGVPPGWIYTRMSDPSQGLLQLLDVERADGVHLDPHNFWVEEGLDKDYKPIHTLQFVDYRADAGAPGKYTLVFTQPDEDVTAPATTLIFDGPALAGETTTYLTPETRIVFTARDNEGGSGVAEMFRKVLGVDGTFIAAAPFSLAVGSHALDFYSVDSAGNVEPAKSAALMVDDAAPQITGALQASPQTFAPQAPAGAQTSRQVTFAFTASDGVPNLPVTLTIVDAAGQVIRTLTGTASSGAAFSLIWDGLDDDGRAVAAGSYTATLTVTDGLEHNTTGQVTVSASEWFAGTPVDPVPGAQQLYPAISDTKVVWQDDRNGHFDIYLKDLAQMASASIRVTSNSGSQEHPAIDGGRIVWQDDRNGDFDIYAYDLTTATETAVYSGAGEQQNPIVAGDWVAWQDNRSGNWDIRAKNLVTGEERQITSHERDQIRPAISGTLLVWEDYRHGLSEIYQYDFSAEAEKRLTFDGANQFLPAVSGNTVVWTDQRDGQQEIYRQNGSSAQRLTYGRGDRSQAALNGNLLIYTDNAAGEDDPNLAFLDLLAGSGGRLTSHPARQEEAAVGAGVVAWQDDRSGTFQITMAELNLAELPVEAQLRPGFNLVAVGQMLVDTYGSAAGLLAAAPAELDIDRTLLYSAPHGQFFEADLAVGDFALTKGAGLILYAGKSGSLPVAAAGEETTFTLLPGTNHLGLLAVPYGYRAYDLLRSVGLDKAIGVRRFDSITGLWQSAAIRDGAAGPEIVGENFPIRGGDGLVVTMKVRVDGWKP